MAVSLKIYYTTDFRKSYQRLPPRIQNIIDRKDVLFRTNPFHANLHTHKLHGPLTGLWSFWVTREYRILFEFVRDGAVLYDVGTHEIYR